VRQVVTRVHTITDSRKAYVFQFQETRSNIDRIVALTLGPECEKEVVGIRC